MQERKVGRVETAPGEPQSPGGAHAGKGDRSGARCLCEASEVLIFACSGASNVGQIANEAALRLRERPGKHPGVWAGGDPMAPSTTHRHQ